MPAEEPRLYHCNRYSADTACPDCGGVIRHETWCRRQNAAVAYAYDAARGKGQLTLEDELILHALGVAWTGKARAATSGW